jgi:hypothetical protein
MCPGWVRLAGVVAAAGGAVGVATPGGAVGVCGDGAAAGAIAGLPTTLGLVWE